MKNRLKIVLQKLRNFFRKKTLDDRILLEREKVRKQLTSHYETIILELRIEHKRLMRETAAELRKEYKKEFKQLKREFLKDKAELEEAIHDRDKLIRDNQKAYRNYMTIMPELHSIISQYTMLKEKETLEKNIEQAKIDHVKDRIEVLDRWVERKSEEMHNLNRDPKNKKY